uniref:Ras-GAP domain-containing protein n=2 Tax=Plectus sambesii TaxID=2011161 RepID=A0A914V764_9BILA
MRFFAAAIVNPKLFGLKRENADATVSRTLALVSKILQRLSNCVVSAQPLTIKEQWMSEIFERFTDEKHRLAMVKFLDRISCVGGENSISGDSVSVLKEGWIMERFAREKRCLKLNWMLHKRRYVVLTETELYWAKAKTEQAMGRLILSEVNLIEPV